MVCPECGTENRPSRKFCLRCGSTLACTCPGCGAANEPEAGFRGDCGARLGVDRAPSGAAAMAIDRAAAARPGAGAANAPIAERRLVTVLFADPVGFTPFAEERDAEEVRETLSRYFELAAGVIGRHGGTVEKLIADAVMAVWGAPAAHEDDAERAVRAGRVRAKVYLERLDAVLADAVLAARGKAEAVPSGSDTSNRRAAART